MPPAVQYLSYGRLREPPETARPRRLCATLDVPGEEPRLVIGQDLDELCRAAVRLGGSRARLVDVRVGGLRAVET